MARKTDLDKIITFKSKEQKQDLTIQGVKKGLDLKNYIEWFLDKLANNKVTINDAS